MVSSYADSPSRQPTRLDAKDISSPRHSESNLEQTVSGTTLGGASLREQDDDVNERSPLLSPNSGGSENGQSDGNTIFEDRDGRHGSGHDESQDTKSLWYLILLTISIGGLQMAWSVELSNGSPYLLSLGLSKSLMALVWIAGPLTGTLVQPYVGMLSDNCRLPWGKRKPFMLGGAAATMVSLMFLAWTKEIVSGFLSLFGADTESRFVKIAIICAAVVGIYVLDFAINTVQAAIRAFIVDCAPAHQQEAANAMASRITGFGNILGYCAGYINLPTYLWFLGGSQFKVLCAIASVALGATVATSTSLIKERDPRLDGLPSKDKPGVLRFFAQIFTSIKRLPTQVKRVCVVQLFSWVGFFPLLFYTSSYIGEIYVEPYLRRNPHMSPEELDELYEQATRVGTFALLINSVVSLLTNVFLPFFVAPTYDSCPVVAGAPVEGSGQSNGEAPRKNSTTPGRHRSWLDYLRIPGFTLKRAWLGSLVLFAVSMFCTVLVRTVEAATALIGLAGVTWAMTLWAPWAIISAEISRRDAVLRASKRQRRARKLADGGNGEQHNKGYDPSGNARFGYDSINKSNNDDNGSNSASPSNTLPLRNRQHNDTTTETEGEEEEAEVEAEVEEIDQAGVILGIHNMAIAAPQIIATVGSSIVFRIWQKPRGVPGDHSISIVLALGGVAVLVSSFFVAGIRENVSAAQALTAASNDDVAAEAGTGNSTVGRAWDAGAADEGGLGRGSGRETEWRGNVDADAGRRSYESLPRVSLERATLTRNRSFGGMEY